MDIGSLVIKIIADSRQLSMGLNSAEQRLLGITQSASKIGRSLTMGLTLPIAATGIAVTKMAMDFETNMTNIYTLMDDATIKSRDWGDEILEMSKKTGESTDTLSKGLYDIISSGIAASDAIGLLDISTKAAKAGLADTAVSVKAITAILNAYGMEASEAGDVSDILFQTVKYGVTTFPELAGAIGGVISTAAAAGVSFEEVGAALAQMTLSGLSTDEAVTALNQVILSFLRPTDQAKKAAEALGFELSATNLATKGLGGVFSELGTKLRVTVDDIIAMEKAGTSENEIMDEMARRTGLSVEAFAELFPNVRALKGALNLARGEGESFNEMLGFMEERTGATESAFAKMAETSKFKFDVALAKLKAAGIDIGQNLLPTVVRLFEWVGKLADKFGELPEPVQNFAIAGLGIVAMIPPLLWLGGNIGSLIIKLKAFRTAQIAANAATTASGAAAGTSALAMAGYATAILAVVAAVGGYFYKLSQETKKYTEEAGSTWKGLLVAGHKMWGMEMTEWQQDVVDAVDKGTESTENATEAEEKRMNKIKELTETLWAYGLAHEGIQELVMGIEDAYNHNMISAEGYEKALQYLIDSQGEWEGSAEELLDTLGLLPDAYYEKKAAMEADTESTNESTEAYENQIKTLEELMDTLFKFYNKNTSVVESIWSYQDASAELNKWLSENKDLTEDQIRNSREYAEKVLGVNKEIQNMVNNVAGLVTGNEELDASQLSVIQQFKSVREAMIHAGLAAVQMKSISYAEFEMWANNVGISTSEVADYISKVYDKYGMMPNLVETEIIAEDLASDTVEAVVGDLNNLEERPNVSIGIEAKDLTFDTIKAILNNLATLQEGADVPVEAKNLITPVLESIVGRLNDIRNEPNIDIPVEIKWLTDTIDTLTKDLDDLRNVPGVNIPVGVEDLITSTLGEITKELDTLSSLSTIIPVEVAPEDKEKVNYDLEYWQNYQIEDKTIETEVDSRETEIKLDELDYYRIGDKKFKVTADTSGAVKNLNSIQQMLNSLKDKSVNVTFKMAQVGAMPAYEHGGLIKAQEGLYAGMGGPKPVLIHPPELIFNEGQALNALWNMGQVRGSPSASSGKLDLSGKIQIELSGEGAENLSESLISDIVTGRIIKHFKEEGARR